MKRYWVLKGSIYYVEPHLDDFIIDTDDISEATRLASDVSEDRWGTVIDTEKKTKTLYVGGTGEVRTVDILDQMD